MQSHIGIGVGKYLEREFDDAKESLWLISPIITKKITEKIIAISNKGVKIRILTNPRVTSESEFANILLKNFVATERKQKPNNETSIDQKIANPNVVPMVHVKLYIIDKRKAIIGSVNLGEKHFWDYAEYLCIFDESDIVSKAISDFEKLWSSCNNYELDSKNKAVFKNILRKFARKLT